MKSTFTRKEVLALLEKQRELSTSEVLLANVDDDTAHKVCKKILELELKF